MIENLKLFENEVDQKKKEEKVIQSTGPFAKWEIIQLND